MAQAKRRAKQRWPYIKKRVYSSGAIGWQVDARTATGGDRRAFETLQEAETYASQCRVRRENEGASAFGNADLARYGKSVQDAINFYLAHLRRVESSKPLKEVVAAFMVEKETVEKRKPRYLGDLRVRLGKFVADFGEQTIATISAEEVTEWLQGLPVGAVTRNTFRRRLAAVFSFAKQRKWLADNPFAGGKKADIKRVDEPRKKVRVLTVEQSAKILESASAETLPFWAVAIFAGLRPESEIGRLRWEDIDFDQRVIVVDGVGSENEETKTGRRVVRMSDNLMEWLLPYSKQIGPLAPAGNFWKKLRADKRKAGFGTPGSESDGERAAGVKLHRWTEDITRHTFGSFLLAKCDDIGVTATQMGNSPDMVRRHYLALVKPKQAAAFWALGPSS